MKKYLLLTMMFAFLAVTSVYAQPKIEVVGGDVVDWKDVKPKDNPLNTEVSIKNVGSEKLVISEVKPTCGCTTAPLDKYELNPGEVAKMKVTLNVGTSSGKVHKTIRISSNDPANSMKVVSLKANIIRPIEITPTTYFTFDKMTVGSESSNKLFLKNNTGTDIVLSDFTVEPANLKINFKGKQVLKPNEKVEFTASVTPQKSGYFNGFVKMKTTDPDTKELEIRCYGNVVESPIFNSK